MPWFCQVLCQIRIWRTDCPIAMQCDLLGSTYPHLAFNWSSAIRWSMEFIIWKAVIMQSICLNMLTSHFVNHVHLWWHDHVQCPLCPHALSQRKRVVHTALLSCMRLLAAACNKWLAIVTMLGLFGTAANWMTLQTGTDMCRLVKAELTWSQGGSEVLCIAPSMFRVVFLTKYSYQIPFWCITAKPGTWSHLAWCTFDARL